MKITYNAPVILTFSILAVVVRFLGDTVTHAFFANTGHLNFDSPFFYLRLFSHIVGHGDWAHLFGNFSLILLIGPIIEEKYGSVKLLIMIMLTALITGLFNSILFDQGLLGASGIVFMLIILGSLANIRSGTIPLTFILIVIIYLGKEVYTAFQPDQISQFAHIVGGICGGAFGLLLSRGETESATAASERPTSPLDL